jgi:hypothetical protein
MADPAPAQSITEHATDVVHALLTLIAEAATNPRVIDCEHIGRLADACESVSRTALRWRDNPDAQPIG